MKLLISNYKIIFFNFNTLNFYENFRLCKISIFNTNSLKVKKLISWSYLSLVFYRF
jgi:hypothetical protein